MDSGEKFEKMTRECLSPWLWPYMLVSSIRYLCYNAAAPTAQWNTNTDFVQKRKIVNVFKSLIYIVLKSIVCPTIRFEIRFGNAVHNFYVFEGIARQTVHFESDLNKFQNFKISFSTPGGTIIQKNMDPSNPHSWFTLHSSLWDTL